MERYQRVEKPKPEQPINENEIRVTSKGLIRNYVTYVTYLFQDKQEKEIILKAMGQAISKAVAIAEIIKTRIPGLHQNISTSSTTITDAYEPIEEGLNLMEMKRQVSLINIALSSVELNKSSSGYQAPIVKQAKTENQQEQQQTRQSIIPSTDRGEGRGGGGGRGRGRVRGGYGYYQENSGYYNWGPEGGRGRGWGYGDAGYERGRGRGRGGGRGYGYGRGRFVGRGRGGGNQA